MSKSSKLLPFAAFLLFFAIGSVLWFATDRMFYLFNFGYIGVSLALGAFLLNRDNKFARVIVQLAIGLYMFAGLGLMRRENMQIEGFWFYLFNGLFQAAAIHYLVAKIVGPLLFGRGWCGWACWTAAVFDFLPYRTPRQPRKTKLGLLRYAVFVVSFVFVASLFMFNATDIETIMWLSFISGNALYYIAGIGLALVLKDNRAFCKYLCPITVFLKPMSYYSLLRFKPKTEKCVHCRLCERKCPMDVEVSNPARNRKNATECILCGECRKVCPQKAF
jgi:polyferredoxin